MGIHTLCTNSLHLHKVLRAGIVYLQVTDEDGQQDSAPQGREAVLGAGFKAVPSSASLPTNHPLKISLINSDTISIAPYHIVNNKLKNK